MATALVEALDRFLEVSAAIRHNRRKRRALRPIEATLATQIARAFRRQGREFVKRFAALKDRFPAEAKLAEAIREHEWGPLLSEAELATLQAFVKPIDRAARRALLTGALQAIAEVGAGISFDLTNPRAVAWLRDRGAERVTKINDTTRDELKRIVTQAAEEGWSYNRTARAIIERFAEFAVGRPQQHIDSRAHLVALTEVAEAYCHGNHLAAQEMQAAGLVMEHYWSNVGDSRVSDGCKENTAADWIPLDQAFPSGHLHPPRFPGCRCDALHRRRPDRVVEATRDLPLLEYPGQPRDRRGRFSSGKAGSKGTELHSEGLGKISSAILQHWPRAVTKRVMLLGERRSHILKRHPEMAEHIPSLRGIILSPNEVHRNAKDRQMAIFYQQKGNKYLRAAVWMSPTKGKRNSVHSLRWAETNEVEAGRKAGRVVWTRK